MKVFKKRIVTIPFLVIPNNNSFIGSMVVTVMLGMKENFASLGKVEVL